MKIKTANLTDTALNWAVAKCEGVTVAKFPESPSLFYGEGLRRFEPDTNWSQGGPIIQREMVSLDWAARMVWNARIYVPDEEPWQADGPTPLIAAMRCFVAMRLGDEVDVPDKMVPRPQADRQASVEDEARRPSPRERGG